MTWQPIETAPTDQTKVDLWVPNVDQPDGGERHPDMVFNEGDISQASDWHHDMYCLSDCGTELEDVTHWMAIPSGPT